MEKKIHVGGQIFKKKCLTIVQLPSSGNLIAVKRPICLDFKSKTFSYISSDGEEWFIDDLSFETMYFIRDWLIVGWDEE